jgi:hypothetical protein
MSTLGIGAVLYIEPRRRRLLAGGSHLGRLYAVARMLIMDVLRDLAGLDAEHLHGAVVRELPVAV